MCSRDQDETGGSPLPRYHVPVMLREAVDSLNVQPGGRYVDCTLGSGGHALAILDAATPGGQLLGLDADPKSLAEARQRLSKYSRDTLLVNDNFANLKQICLSNNFAPVSGILFDLGLSSRQLDSAERGFSFQHDSPLDMRFGPTQELTASDIVNGYAEEELAGLLFQFGEETRSRQIARQIVLARPMRSTRDLVNAVLKATASHPRDRIHPATKTFQALRIAVNQELRTLPSALEQTLDLLGFQGRLVVISYHSLEDRIVKNFLRKESTGCVCPPEVLSCICNHVAKLRLVHRKAAKPSAEEVLSNPRSRSARLRAAERI
ncbi:MAG: 16S rRNA (cytosine(1402)-N(4))-methyltransferase RsmH [Chloroflexi bacterium]|nr:16S rRNA (cytosine(1402)-N(4))-methyltransferase RsmH [Chloroflexota bacterium]